MVLFLAVIYMTSSFTASVDVVLLVSLDTLQHCNNVSSEEPLLDGSFGGQARPYFNHYFQVLQIIHPYTRFVFLFYSLPLN